MKLPTETDEKWRKEAIRLNRAEYFEASSDYSHLMWKASNAQARMDRAIENLKSIGAHDEAEKLSRK